MKTFINKFFGTKKVATLSTLMLAVLLLTGFKTTDYILTLGANNNHKIKADTGDTLLKFSNDAGSTYVPFVGTTTTQALTNKDIDGGTASNTHRITLPKDTKTNLDSLTRKAGTIVYGTDTAVPYIDNGSSLIQMGLARRVYVTTFTSSGTWTKATLNPLFVKITVVGGGGGGGGTATTGGSEAAMAGGGGGGGWCIKAIPAASLGTTETVTVGTGGAQPSGNNAGGTGGTSSFGSHCSATGGTGGSGSASTTTIQLAAGGDGGVGSNGDINGNGDDGGPGRVLSGTFIPTGYGGGTLTAGSARCTGSNGTAGKNYGGGGSGTGAPASNSARTGTAGAAGIVIVEEYAL